MKNKIEIPDMTEAEFLKLQADRAKHRLLGEARELGRDLAGPLDPRPTVRRHPWWSLTGSLALGVAAGFGLGGWRPDRTPRAERLRARLQRAEREAREARAALAAKDGAAPKGGTLATVVRSVQAVLRAGVAAAAFARREAAASRAPGHNGAHADEGVPTA